MILSVAENMAARAGRRHPISAPDSCNRNDAEMPLHELRLQQALKHRLASVELARAGGFVGHGVDFPDMWHRSATFVDKILKGTKPADLPIEQSTKFVTSVNLKTAKAIGIDVPTSLLLRADEVIE
jgi:putative ABC transport system substrate-binding protein